METLLILVIWCSETQNHAMWESSEMCLKSAVKCWQGLENWEAQDLAIECLIKDKVKEK